MQISATDANAHLTDSVSRAEVSRDISVTLAF